MDSKRTDVVRNQFPATTRAVNRALGSDIYCCVHEGGAETDETGTVEVCSLDELIIDDTYRRVFLSATLAGSGPSFGIGTYSLRMTIQCALTGLVLIPVITSSVPFEPKTITSAIDLAPGTYRFVLSVASVDFGSGIYCGEASLQAIVGQVVPTQQCFRTDHPCG